MKGVDHIGIAVSDLEASNKLFEALLNTKCYKIENIPDQKVLTSFFKTRDQKIELVAATDSSSPISKFLDKKGEGRRREKDQIKGDYSWRSHQDSWRSDQRRFRSACGAGEEAGITLHADISSFSLSLFLRHDTLCRDWSTDSSW